VLGARGLAIVVVVGGGAACGRIGFSDLVGGAPDGGGDGAGSCGFDLCDGFEAPAIDTSLWTVDANVTRDTSQAHSGAASAHMHVDALPVNTDGSALIYETKTLASGSVPFWLRAWVRIDVLPVANNYMELFYAEQTNSPHLGDYLIVRRTDTQLYDDFDSAFVGTNAALPVDTWVCLIWQVVPLASGGSIALSGDAPSIALANNSTDGSPPIRNIALGVYFDGTNLATAQPAVDVWIDDVIINSSAVTCTD